MAQSRRQFIDTLVRSGTALGIVSTFAGCGGDESDSELAEKHILQSGQQADLNDPDYGVLIARAERTGNSDDWHLAGLRAQEAGDTNQAVRCYYNSLNGLNNKDYDQALVKRRRAREGIRAWEQLAKNPRSSKNTGNRSFLSYGDDLHESAYISFVRFIGKEGNRDRDLRELSYHLAKTIVLADSDSFGRSDLGRANTAAQNFDRLRTTVGKHRLETAMDYALNALYKQNPLFTHQQRDHVYARLGMRVQLSSAQ